MRIGHIFYADAGLRLSTPLAPAIRLGADRILVVARSRAKCSSRSRTRGCDRLAMRGLRVGTSHTAESGLFSYMLFDGDYFAPLAELGFRDAAAQEEGLVRFSRTIED